MQGKTYPAIESFLEDAAEGWKTWRESTPLPALTNSEETAIIKAALHRADIHPKRIRHYRGPVIITMDRPEKYEGEFCRSKLWPGKLLMQPPMPATSAAAYMFSASSTASSPRAINDSGGVRDEAKKQE